VVAGDAVVDGTASDITAGVDAVATRAEVVEPTLVVSTKQ